MYIEGIPKERDEKWPTLLKIVLFNDQWHFVQIGFD